MSVRFTLCVLILLHPHASQLVMTSGTDQGPVVETNSGSVRGRLASLPLSTSVNEFLGIPYAEPPARFAPPEPVRPWTGVREALQFGARCPQPAAPNNQAPMSLTPDCLFLNVFAPPTASPKSKLAVMVYIHGGGFTYSSSNEYPAGVLAAFNDVIVVTFNYRLGVIGFFNVPGTELKGNYGMLDQVLALKWIQANIASFGGDPERVTIFGESGGGIAVSLHLISPLSKGLFQRAIAQSGAASMPVFSNKPNGVQLQHFAEKVGCPAEPSELAKCVQEKKLEDILAVQGSISFPESNEFQDITGPSVDGEFLPDLGESLYKSGQYHAVDVMLGVTSNEGALTPLNLSPNASRDGLAPGVFERHVREGMVLARSGEDLVKELVLFEYTDHSDPDDPMKVAQRVQDLNSDCLFVAPATLEAQALASGSIKPYFYVFDHRPTFSIFPGSSGAFHGADLFYVFGAPYKSLGGFFDVFVPAFSELEKGLSSYVMKLWTNFAKFGDPNHSEDGRTLVTWPKFTPEEQSYLAIGLEPKVQHRFRADKVAFWNRLIPKIAEGTPTSQRAAEGNSGKDEL